MKHLAINVMDRHHLNVQLVNLIDFYIIINAYYLARMDFIKIILRINVINVMQIASPARVIYKLNVIHALEINHYCKVSV